MKRVLRFDYISVLYADSLFLGLELVEIERLAIPHDEGAIAHPVASDQQAGGSAQHQVEHDVSMAEKEEVDVGVALQVFFGKLNQVLTAFALISLLVGLGQSALAAAQRPA